MKLSPEKIKKIAILRALQLGDLLCSIPAVRALRAAYPEASITLLGLPWEEQLIGMFPQYFNRFIHFPGYPGLPEQTLNPASFTGFLSLMQKEQFDLVIQMQGNGTIINPMMELLNATYTAGFCMVNDYCPDNNLYVYYPQGISEIERHVQLMADLGIPPQGLQLEFPLTEKDYNDAEALGLPIQTKKYVCLHPGSRGAWRQWPPEYFAALADYCIKEGYPVVITGTAGERDIVDAVLAHMQQEAIDASGKTSLGVVGVLIKNAGMLIANCTGVSHIASAFETPSIIISMDGEPERWAPLNKILHRTIDWTKTQDYSVVYKETTSLLGSLVAS